MKELKNQASVRGVSGKKMLFRPLFSLSGPLLLGLLPFLSVAQVLSPYESVLSLDSGVAQLEKGVKPTPPEGTETNT